MRILPIIFLKPKLKTLLDILNLALEISHDVALLLRGDLLHVLLHIIALLLGVIIALVPKLNLTLIAGHGLQLGLLYHATVLFLGIRTLLLVSSLILLLIFSGSLLLVVHCCCPCRV